MTMFNPARLLTLCALLLLLTGQVFSQEWKKIPFPIPHDLPGVCFISKDTGFVCTVKGSVARTLNGGVEWKSREISYGNPLEDVCFYDIKFGVVCGRRGALFLTRDGGITWENHSLKDTIPALVDVEFFTPAIGMAVGIALDTLGRANPVALRTVDSGHTWVPIKTVGLGYSELFYREGTPVFLQSMGYLFSSKDLGKSWSSVPTVDGQIGRAMSFAGTTGILAGLGGMCAYSIDGGYNWTPNPQGNGTSVFIAAEMVDEQTGFIAGRGGEILRTDDRGRTWKAETPEVKFDILDLSRVGNRIYAVGKDGNILVRNLPTLKLK
jgi:Photosynthesis system II assembly factor YCF48